MTRSLRMRSIRGLRALLAATCCLAGAAGSADPASVTLDRAEVAGIDGRSWDAAFPGAMTVDAVHRSVLVRFPGASDVLKAKLDSGLSIAKAELGLDYDGYEVVPDGYVVRRSQGEQKWKQNPPRWHVVAWALRRAWRADAQSGPTFNAFRNGAGYWARYGASDAQRDRYDATFGPAELSHVTRSASLDVTQALNDPQFGEDAVRRLRSIEENGLMLRKLETYDQRYREPGDAYEWAVPTGGHGLKFRNPRLVVTFAPSPAKAAAARSSSAGSPATDAAAGAPTAVMPSPAAFRLLAQRVAPRRPDTMPPWQFERVLELYRVGGDRVSAWAKAVESGDYKTYAQLVREILVTPPRFWRGWSIQDDLLIWHLYRDLLPPYVQDHVRNYWSAWLMPDVATADLVHPQSKEAIAYQEKTGDWRGRASFFRDGYNYQTSTQNFNHIAAMGALLGGNLIGSERAVADGRHGLEYFPLRLWGVFDGTTQEMLDHYYFSITLSAQKMFADFGPTAVDRLMGRILVDRSIELLATAYHPALRRLVGASGRARLPGILVEQDGIYGVLHTLSRKGVVSYVDRAVDARVHGMPVWGQDFPPGRVALQALQGEWAPDWMTNVVDEKSFPFEETSTETTRGTFDPPLWRRTYLGRHYGLASQDIKGGTADVMAQWNHRSEPARAMEDLGTLTLRYAINEPDMATTNGGAMPHAGGVLTYQHRNRAIVCTKPRTEKARVIAIAGKEGLKSLASVIALWNFRATPDWEIRVDGERLTRFPAKAKSGQVITIRDGVAFIGIVPLPATNLGRSDEVVIGFGGGGRTEPHGAPIKPALTITSYNFQKETAAAFDTLDWGAINTATHGGFVIELGDASEYPDFAAFEKRMRANRLAAEWDSRARVLHVKYQSGSDLMEMGCSTDFAQSEIHYGVAQGQQTKAIPYRRINGAFPYLPRGIDRDTSLAQQGTSGRLEKNGAVLVSEKGRKAYLITEPRSGTYTGYNPLPDPADWSLAAPGGVSIAANGKVGLLRLSVRPAANRLWIDYATKPGQGSGATATHLRVAGFTAEPVVQRNGKRLAGPFDTALFDGKRAFLIPLNDN